MKRIFFIIWSVLAVSCSRQQADTDNAANCIGGWFGRYVVEKSIEGWNEPFQPNMSVGLTLFDDMSCDINVGLMAWPYKTETDSFHYHYGIIPTGLVLYGSGPEDPLFTVSSNDLHPEVNPEEYPDLYLGGLPLTVSWNKGLGKTWDKYATLAGWPRSITVHFTTLD